MRICIAATPSVAVPTLDALLASGHQIVSVITRPEAPAGRGRNFRSSAVSDWASLNKVQLHKPESSDEISLLVAQCDLVVTIGFGVLLPETVLNIPKFGFINLHFSLLPRWRGAAPVQRALEAGDSTTGVTVFKLDAGMDTGPIYTSLPFDISPTTNTADLLENLASLGVQAVLDAISLIESGQSPKVQSSEDATRAYKLTSEEAQIDWSQGSLAIVKDLFKYYKIPIMSIFSIYVTFLAFTRLGTVPGIFSIITLALIYFGIIGIDMFKPINEENLSPVVSYEQAVKIDVKPLPKQKNGFLSDLIFGKQSGGNITKELKNISKTYFNKKT